MQKNILVAAFFFLLTSAANAQNDPGVVLAGTTWKGVFSIPEPMECLLQFQSDTIKMIYAGARSINIGDGRSITAEDSASLETMIYIRRGDTLELHKVQGGSPCDNDQKGIYLFKITNEKLRLTAVSDPCIDRSSALESEMKRVVRGQRAIDDQQKHT